MAKSKKTMPNLTGIWYNPYLDGSGMSIHDTEDAFVAYWYTYAKGLPTEKDHGQIWMIGQPEDPRQRYHLSFYRPEGRWMGEKYKLGDPVAYGHFVMDGDVLTLDYRLVGLGPCLPVNFSPVWGGCNWVWNLKRLV